MIDFSDPNPVGKTIMAGSTPLEFISPTLNKRKLIRSTKNPMDKCTLVSIFPGRIDELKHTLEEGRFTIEAGSYEQPSTLLITGHSWWKDYDWEQPLLEISVSSIQISDSVIKDYCNSMLGSNMDDSMPGLFYVLGELNAVEIKMKYKNKLAEVKAKQDNWYKILVRIADSLWARTNGNPLAIWDLMRLAARELNLNDKPWLKDFQIAELVRCFACGGMRNPLFPVCPTCKAIDVSHPEAKNLKFAV
jgi:hypothetical protein